MNEGWTDQLSQIKPKVTKTPEQEPIINLEEGTIEAQTPAGRSRVELSSKDQREMIENALKLQKMSILEKKLAMGINAVMLLLGIATVGGTVYATIQGARGKTLANP